MSILSFHFNTSHVKVYQQKTMYTETQPDDFNTSHVKVYRWSTEGNTAQKQISIHLMLRFIVALLSGALLPSPFQYISC